MVSLALLGLFLVATPVWLPWALRPLVEGVGAGVQDYRRLSYTRLALSGASFTNVNVRVTVEHLELPFPGAWAYRLLRGDTNVYVTATNWQVVITPTGRKDPSIHRNVRDVVKVARVVPRWIPRAAVYDGKIDAPGFSVLISEAHVSGASVVGKARLPQSTGPELISADLSGSGPWEVTIRSSSLEVDSQHSVSLTSTSVDLHSELFWRSNRVQVDARFGPLGEWPQSAKLNAQDVVIPAEAFQLGGYSNLFGSLVGTWESGKFSADLKAKVDGVPDASLPRVTAELHASGNTNEAFLELARISSPWLSASLSRNLKVSFTTPHFPEPGVLNVSAKLDQQPWIPVSGIVDGQVFFWPGDSRFPRAHFELMGTNVSSALLQSDRVMVQGLFEYPWVRVTNSAITVRPDLVAAISGDLNLTNLTTTNGAVLLQGTPPQALVPSNWLLGEVRGQASFSGPIREMTHSGELFLTQVTNANYRLDSLTAAWQGQWPGSIRSQISARAGTSIASLDASIGSLRAPVSIRLHSASLSSNAQPILSLAREATLSFSNTNGVRQLSVASFDLYGSNRNVTAQGEFRWPETGAFEVRASGLNASLLEDFVRSRLPPFEVPLFSASGAWSNGPVAFDARLTAALTSSNSFAASLAVSGGSEGLLVSEARIGGFGSTLGEASGFVPLVIWPGKTNHLVVDASRQVDFRASAKPSEPALEELFRWTGVRLALPVGDLKIRGPMSAPVGDLQIRVNRADLRPQQTNLPPFTDVIIAAKIDGEIARVVQGRFLVGGQRVAFTGEVPLGSNYWNSVIAEPLPNLERGSAHLLVEEADIAPFAGLSGDIIAPQGEISINASLQPGLKLSGAVTIQGARTRPLPNIGPIRDIELRFAFRERALELTDGTINVGGSAVQMGGHFDLSGTEWMRTGVPPFRFHLYGTNIPVSRQPESIVRTDLDLTVVKTNAQPALITGTATLRDSYFMSDLADLVPGKVASPSRRPPYFSVEAEPFSAWKLDLQVIGKNFMKVRSPLFTGTVSANLKLGGTLHDPIGTGDLKIDSGKIRFPFGSLQVQQGLVSLTSANPYQPQLEVMAASRQFGYDIRMEVKGPATGPLVQFSSTPPLTSEEILLMITAGEMPRRDHNFSSTQRAQSLALFLGKDLLARLGYGDYSESRLTLRSGEELSATGRSTYNVEYRLADRWSVVGEYDRFGDFNVGAKWRVYSK